MSYKIQANYEGVEEQIEETFKYRYMAFKAAKFALKKGMIVRLIKVASPQPKEEQQ